MPFRGLLSFVVLCIGFPLYASPVQFSSVGSTANGVVQIWAPASATSPKAALDIFQNRYPFFCQHQLWTAIVPVVDYMAGTYEFQVVYDESDNRPTQSISISINEGNDEWNTIQKDIRDLVFNLKLLIHTRHQSTANTLAESEEANLVRNRQIQLIQSLAENRDNYLIVNRNLALSGDQIGPLYLQLAAIERQLDNTRDALIQKSKLVDLLNPHPSKGKQRVPKRDLNAIRAAYIQYFATTQPITPSDKATLISAIKIESSRLYQQKLNELAQRDAVIAAISEQLRLYPKSTRSPTANERPKIEIATRYEWTTPEAIQRRLNETLRLLNNTATHPFPVDIERRMLQILDLKNGRADFFEYWVSDSISIKSTVGDSGEIETFLAADLSALQHRLAQQRFDELTRQGDQLNQELESQKAQNKALTSLLDELNEAVKKKISAHIQSE